MKKAKNKITLAVLFLALGNSGIVNASSETIEDVTSEIRSHTIALYSAITEDEKIAASNELKKHIKKMEKFDYISNYKASRAMVKALAEPEYQYADKDKAEKILEDAFEVDNHRKAHIFAKMMMDTNLLIYDKDAAEELMQECAEYGNSRCDRSVVKERSGVKGEKSEATHQEKQFTEEKVRQIERKDLSKITAEDSDYYLSAYNNGYHKNREKLEEIMFHGAATLDSSAIEILFQMYAQKILFQPSEEKMFKIKYLKSISVGKQSREYAFMSNRAKELGRIGEKWKQDVDSMVAKQRVFTSR